MNLLFAYPALLELCHHRVKPVLLHRQELVLSHLPSAIVCYVAGPSLPWVRGDDLNMALNLEMQHKPDIRPSIRKFLCYIG